MTHIAVLADEKRPAVCTADLWRSPGWRVPFGPDEVRATRMPAAGEIIPGRNVSDDSVADFMAESGRAAVLVALADLLGDVLARRADAPADKTTTVLLGTDSTDEAALWVGALQRTCAPCTGRRLGFSTLERVGSARDIESLMASGVDLACVPRRDLEALSAHHDLVLVDLPRGAELPSGCLCLLVTGLDLRSAVATEALVARARSTRAENVSVALAVRPVGEDVSPDDLEAMTGARVMARIPHDRAVAQRVARGDDPTRGRGGTRRAARAVAGELVGLAGEGSPW